MSIISMTSVYEPLNHIHQDTKLAQLIAVCKRSRDQKQRYIKSMI